MTPEEKVARIKELQSCKLPRAPRNAIAQEAFSESDTAEWEWWMKTEIGILEHIQSFSEVSMAGRVRIRNVIKGILSDLQQPMHSSAAP